MEASNREVTRSRPWWLLPWILAGAVGASVGWCFADGRSEWVLSFGGSAELFGLIFTASPELQPMTVAAWARVRASARRGIGRLRALLRRPRVIHASTGIASSGEMAGSISVIKGVREDATLEERVEWLLNRDREAQEEAKKLRQELHELPKQWATDIEAVSTALRLEIQQNLDEVRDFRLGDRLNGIALLAVGIVLATWGNLA
jgi:hypothetical protein